MKENETRNMLTVYPLCYMWKKGEDKSVVWIGSPRICKSNSL